MRTLRGLRELRACTQLLVGFGPRLDDAAFEDHDVLSQQPDRESRMGRRPSGVELRDRCHGTRGINPR